MQQGRGWVRESGIWCDQKGKIQRLKSGQATPYLTDTRPDLAIPSGKFKPTCSLPFLSLQLPHKSWQKTAQSPGLNTAQGDCLCAGPMGPSSCSQR